MNGVVEHIHIAPRAGAAMRSLGSVGVQADVGLDGDRYAVGRGHFSSDRRVSRDITLIEGEAIEALQVEHQITLLPGETRRNLTTVGINLNALVGRRFYVGDVLCAGTRLCNPCQYLADLISKPLVRPLVGRGGLRADLLTDGVISVGDRVEAALPADVVIGTRNPEKAHQVELALAGLDIRTHRLLDLVPSAPEVDEPYEDPRRNAHAKAHAYAQLVRDPVLALDFALFFDGVTEELQPGTLVRRFLGSDLPLEDDALIRYYAALVDRHGGHLNGRWHVAIAIAKSDSILRADVMVTRRFVSTPSPRRLAGYPLASLQMSGQRYVSELADNPMIYPEIAPVLRRLVAGGVSRRK